MTKVVKIGTIELDNPLFIQEEFKAKVGKAKTFGTLNGGAIVYESVKRNNADYITLISKNSGWIKEDTLQNILLLLDDLGVEIDIELESGSTIKVRPALEKDIIQTEDIINENGGWYSVKISLCRV